MFSDLCGGISVGVYGCVFTYCDVYLRGVKSFCQKSPLTQQ